MNKQRQLFPTTLEMVEEFITLFNRPNDVRDVPYIDDIKNNSLCYDLIEEELHELGEALRIADPVAILDALTDIQYTLDFAYVRLGFYNVKDAAFKEVHLSNMSKLGADGKPVLNDKGKVQKGPNYFKPNLLQFVERLTNAGKN